ncbi:TcpQ domain-containing protein [Paludibacterium paludis]|uniref:Toxin co-regulated pilus biosynthesis protein Q C-terminal domain-containing protein n=1 Tax=Paludibacterium paludis TaxID=1225769 RepID=A0A918UB38_9NEIS|nr:TcpQ domain-containing protein [Paludibacterium paludis]GGY20803.1 hypothetical protein GCM10011289_25540 [Paludibacterium paludis]
MRPDSLTASLSVAAMWLALSCQTAAAAPALAAPQASAPVAQALPAAPATAGDIDMSQSRLWTIDADQVSVEDVLGSWTRQAGWTLKWDVPYSLSIHATASVPGTLPEAVAKLLDGVHSTDDPIAAQFYKGNKVLRVFVE